MVLRAIQGGKELSIAQTGLACEGDPALPGAFTLDQSQLKFASANFR
jgi:hypothetical protein